MSTRVCLAIPYLWLVLVANANGQAGRFDEQTGPLVSSEPVSNAARSVSNPQDGVVGDASRSAAPRPPANATGIDAGKLAPMPLPPRSKQQVRATVAKGESNSTSRALVTVVSSLAVVLAVFFAFVWLTRSAAPRGMAPLSKEVVESLGRAPLLGRQQMQLIRVGNKLILLSVTATGADTLTEITDPVEVDRLSGLCRQAQSGSISDSFRQVLAQASAEPAASARGAQRQDRRSGNLEPRRA